MRVLVIFVAFAALAVAADFHIDYAIYLGGAGDEQAAGIRVDSDGNAYVVGTTSSPDYPLTSTAFGSPSPDHGCAFLTKLNAEGNAIVWSVCLANTTGNRVALDSAGNVYVLTTDSTSTSNITKLTPGADKILYSKSLGASATGIAVDAVGNAYATGYTGPGFATTPGAYQTTLTTGTCKGGPGLGLIPYPCPDAYIIKLKGDGSVAYATYLGGSGPDQARAIAVDSQGNAWITGDAASPDFPITAGALGPKFHGEIDLGPLRYGDAFVAKLDPTGRRLLYSSYIGGSAPDAGFAIAVDASDAAYIAGGTQSTDFPTTPDAVQRAYGGGSPIPSLTGDAFIVKLAASGATVYSTYLGGPLDESATVIQVDGQGNAYVNAYPNQSTRNPRTLSVVSSDGSTILKSAAVSGWFAVDRQGSVYVGGGTLGYVFFPTARPAQPKFGGGTYDATVVKIDFEGPASAWIASIVNAASFRSGTPSFYPVFDVAPGEIITVFGGGFDAGTRVFFDGMPAPILYVQSDQINAVVPFGVKGSTTAITIASSGQTLGPGTMNVFDAVPAIFTLSGTGTGQAAVLNQDGSVNSTLNPAARGSIISVFMTGAGRMDPSPPDGAPTPASPPFPVPVLGVGASIGQVVYAGAAPGLVAGAVQVNVRLSDTVSPGDHVPIVIYIGNYASGFAGDTTVAVR